MEKLKVFLADDHEIIRQGLRLLIDRQPDLEVLGEAGDGKTAIQLALEQKPDVVIMDISMPTLSGAKATEQLKKALPHTKILVLTRHNDSSYVQELLRLGADGYLLKQSNSDELLRAIRAIVGGDAYIDPALISKVLGGYVERLSGKGLATSGTLSQREEETLRYIAYGYSNKEIAAHLDLSVKTIEAHKANAMRKLELHSRIDIMRYALLKDWLQDP